MATAYLIGDPVAHSLSPAMQNAAFGALGLPHRYELLRVPAAELSGAIERLRREDALGANVTIPHKELVARSLDAVDDGAHRIGAVNTIYKRGGQLRGDNTDVHGLAGALTEKGIEVAGKRVLVLGAGGAARACVDHLVRSGARIRLTNRTRDRARALAEAATPASSRGGVVVNELGVTEWPIDRLAEYDVVVNATSLGLHGEDPLEGVDLPAECVVVDVVAVASETPLIARARAAGCVVVDGLLMLLHQGTSAFRLWTGLDAPVAAMRAALPRQV